jgi:hypothetical protein
VRRGPFAKPTQTEQLEYLFTRVAKKDSRKDFEKCALEHVLSYQRRILAIKKYFLVRGKKTALGVVEDYWDRTEAQQRGSLHSHTLCWFKRKLRPRNWGPLPPISATRQGATAKQRSITTKPLLKLTTDEFQEDSLYQLSEIARISGEMPRPDVSTTSSVKWGGYDWDSLRIAGLARGVLTKLNYMHVCTPAYCLLNRSSCRFFFPWCEAFEAASLSTRKLFANHLHVVCFKGHWPQQPYQVYDENTQRLALRRQLCDDDQWVTQ